MNMILGGRRCLLYSKCLCLNNCLYLPLRDVTVLLVKSPKSFLCKLRWTNSGPADGWRVCERLVAQISIKSLGNEQRRVSLYSLILYTPSCLRHERANITRTAEKRGDPWDVRLYWVFIAIRALNRQSWIVTSSQPVVLLIFPQLHFSYSVDMAMMAWPNGPSACPFRPWIIIVIMRLVVRLVFLDVIVASLAYIDDIDI